MSQNTDLTVGLVQNPETGESTFWDMKGSAGRSDPHGAGEPDMMMLAISQQTFFTKNPEWFRRLIDQANAALVAAKYPSHKPGASPLGDLRYVDFTATGLMDEQISCGANLGRTGFVFEIKDGDQFTMFTLANDDAIRLSDAIKPMKITPEMFGAATAAVLEASESGKMFEDEPYNIVKAVMKVFGLELDTPPKDGKAAA